MSDECQIVFELPRSKSTELDGTHSAAIALFCLEGRTPARRARTRPKFEIGQRLLASAVRSPFQTRSPNLASSSSTRTSDPPPHPSGYCSATSASATPQMLSDDFDDELGAASSAPPPARFELQEDPSFWKDNNVQVGSSPLRLGLLPPLLPLCYFSCSGGEGLWSVYASTSSSTSWCGGSLNCSNLQVVIRIRPLSSSEISVQGHKTCVRQDSCQSLTWTGHPESRFTFDLVADEHVTQVPSMLPVPV
jgi:hypothetical protein